MSLPKQGGGTEVAVVKVVIAPTTERMRCRKVAAAAGGAGTPTPPGALLSAQGGRGRRMGREAAVVPPL